MTTAYTSLLGLALPVPGELTGTWGTVVNDNITSLIESSVAGVATVDVAGADWTLTTTGGGAANEQRMAIIRVTGSSGTTRNVIAPAKSKIYVVVNASTGPVVFKSSTSTGVTIAVGQTTMVAWNSASSSPDFVEVAPKSVNTATNLAGGGVGQVPYQSAAGTTAMLSAGTSGQVLTSSGAGAPTWTTPATGLLSWSIKTTTYTAVAGNAILANTTSGAFTITLPASASISDTISIADYAGTFATNNLTVNSNGLNLMGSVQTLILDVNYRNVTLVYSGATEGWVITL